MLGRSLLTIGLLAGATASAENDSDENGVVSPASLGFNGQGSASVDKLHGAFTHSIPIEVPPFHTLEPKLALTYSSTPINGLLGVGWYLSGLSQIQRMSPGRGTPRLDGTDIYVLDGLELAACAAGSVSPSCTTPCPTGSTCYSTRIESYRRIARAGNGTWTIWEKNGTRATYSTTAGLVGTTPTKWLLTQVADRRANQVNYAYRVGTDGWTYPSSISYSNGISVAFYTEARTDEVITALGGALSSMRERLKTIAMKVGTSYARAYGLTYEPSDVTKQSLMNTVRQYGKDVVLSSSGVVTSGSALPPFTATFNIEATGKFDAVQSIGGWCDFGTYLLAEFNGDGKADLYCRTVGNGINRVQVKLSNGRGGFSNGVNTDGFCGTSNIKIADFNGDGKGDLICDSSGGKTLVRLGVGDGSFQQTAVDSGTWCAGSIKVGDFNGDASADILCKKEGKRVAVRMSNGAGGFAPEIVEATAWCEGAKIQLADFNGDGKADLLCDSNYSRIRLGDGLGNFSPEKKTGPGFCDRLVSLADINGDGKADMFCFTSAGLVKVQLGDGSGGFGGKVSNQSCLNNPEYSLYTSAGLADFNGDNKLDMYCVWNILPTVANSSGDYGLSISFGDGKGNFVFDHGLDRWKDQVLVADFNGDGKSDLLYRYEDINGASRVSVALENSSGPDTHAPLAIALTSNGLGGATIVEYKPSSAWSNAYFPVLFQTASAVTMDNGRGDLARTSYTYSGGRWDPVNRRSLGFQVVTETLPCATALASDGTCPKPLAVTTTYRQRPGLVSVAETIEKKSGGVLLESTTNEYSDNTAVLPYRSLHVAQWDRVYDRLGTNCPAHCKRTLKRMEYDAYGNVTRLTDYGDYDLSTDAARGTVGIIATDYVPNKADYIVGLPARQRVYSGFAPTIVRAETQYVYDQAGSTAPNWTLAPTKGDQTQELRWLDTENRFVRKLMTYDAWGNVLTATDEVGNTTRTTYDSAYHWLATSVTNALNQVVNNVAIDYACGIVTKTQGLNGPNDLTQTTLDSFCRPTLVTTPLGGFTKTTYCSSGSTSSRCGTLSGSGAQNVLSESPSADGQTNQWKRSYFDGLGRVYRTAMKGAGGGAIYQDSAYSLRGDLVSVSEPYSTGTPKASTTRHDALGRVERETNLDLTYREHSYGPWSVTTKDELGRPTTMVNDAHGNVIAKKFVINGVTHQTTYTYDLFDNQIGIVDAGGATWTRKFDSLGRMTEDADPDRGTWKYTYYDSGKMKSQLDAKQQITMFAYDGLYRKISETGTAISKGWRYDEARPGYFNVGKLSTMVDQSGWAAYDYDLAGNQVRMAKTIGSQTFTFQSGYDAGARIKWTTYPDGDTLGTPANPLAYDGAGLPYSVPSVVTSASYKSWGAPATIEYANGTVVTYTYDTNQRVKTIVASKGGVPLQSLTYTRYADGKIASIASPFAAESWTYAYDDVGRLASATSVGNAADNQSFTYAPNGNILTNSRLPGVYTYGTTSRPHAVVSAGGVAYGYDANGSMTSRGGTVYSWDTANRLASVGSTSFTYDADNERVRKVSNTGTSYYPRADYRVIGQVATKNIKFGNQLVAERAGTTTKWLYGDHLQSVQVAANASGTVVQRLGHRPFGERFNVTTPIEEENDFLGERRDAETGLVYQRVRYYDPVLARYTSADPTDPNQTGVGTNRYAYSLNDPVNLLDNGREAIDAKVDYLAARQHVIDTIKAGATPIVFFAGIQNGSGTSGLRETLDAFERRSGVTDYVVVPNIGNFRPNFDTLKATVNAEIATGESNAARIGTSLINIAGTYGGAHSLNVFAHSNGNATAADAIRESFKLDRPVIKHFTAIEPNADKGDLDVIAGGSKDLFVISASSRDLALSAAFLGCRYHCADRRITERGSGAKTLPSDVLGHSVDSNLGQGYHASPFANDPSSLFYQGSGHGSGSTYGAGHP